MLYNLYTSGQFSWDMLASRLATLLAEKFGGAYVELYKLIIGRSSLFYTIKSAISDGVWTWDEIVSVAIAIADIVIGVIPAAKWWSIVTLLWDFFSFA